MVLLLSPEGHWAPGGWGPPFATSMSVVVTVAALNVNSHPYMCQVRYLQGEGERLREKIRHLERNLQASHQVQVHSCPYT